MRDTEPLARSLGSTERRQWTRFPSRGMRVSIRSQTGCQSAKVSDNSFGGIALHVDDASALREGQQVELLFSKTSISAVVHRIQRLSESAGFRIALQWVADESFIRKILDNVLDAQTNEAVERRGDETGGTTDTQPFCS